MQRVKKTKCLYVHCIGTGGRSRRCCYSIACLKVAVVDGESQFLLVHVLDQVRNPELSLNVAVRHVTPEADSVRLVVVVTIVVVPVVALAIGSMLGGCFPDPRSRRDNENG